MSEESLEKESDRSEVIRISAQAETPGSEQRVGEVKTATATRPHSVSSRTVTIISIVAIVSLAAVLFLVLRSWGGAAETHGKVNPEAGAHQDEPGGAGEHKAEHGDQHGAGEAEEVQLSPEALEAAGLEVEGVTQRPAVALLRVTGTVEVNQQQTQQATPLVGGRVERVFAGLGDRVRAGAVLAVIASPQIAQMHGKLHEAETQLALAQRNLQRVKRAENRVAVLQAKARLDEADATLRRTRRLIELGVGAGKDLIAAETAYQTAKAEYDFQSNISLNREVQEAQAAVETARVDVAHIRDEMRALGAPIPEGESDRDHSRNSSFVAVHTPVSGVVTERLVNPGAGIEAGQALFTIANLSTVWVMANVPEAQISSLRPRTPAEIRSAALGQNAIAGRVDYIDPQLNEETRTARARIVVPNAGERLKAGMFVEVGFQTGTGAATGEELVVNSAAVQRLGERTIVFVPKKDEPRTFEVREVELGGETNGYRRVLGGLELGDRVVTKGSFALKTQLLKGQLEHDDH